MSGAVTHATYLLETPLSLERAAEALVGEQGVRSRDRGHDGRPLAPGFRAEVTAIRALDPTDRPALVGRYPAGVKGFARAEVDVAIPLAVTGPDLLNVAAALLGNVFELREVSGLRLLRFTAPDELVRAVPGPAFGVGGTRALAGVTEPRPLVGSIVKPSVGLTPVETAERVRVLAEAGIDFVKDDELLANPRVSPLALRVEEVMRAVHAVADRTGRQAMFAFNISADDLDTMLRNHEAVVAAGGTCVMVSVNQVGLGALLALRRRCALPIHGHRNGWGMLTRSPSLGMDFAAFQAIWRMAGVDQLHVNGFSNKFFESDESVARSIKECLATYGGLDPILPVLSSGQWGGQAPATYAATGTTDLLYLAGGGIQGHPGGFAAGVAAVRAAWEAAVAGEPLEQRARRQPELAQAIERFGAVVGR